MQVPLCSEMLFWRVHRVVFHDGVRMFGDSPPIAYAVGQQFHIVLSPTIPPFPPSPLPTRPPQSCAQRPRPRASGPEPQARAPGLGPRAPGPGLAPQASRPRPGPRASGPGPRAPARPQVPGLCPRSGLQKGPITLFLKSAKMKKCSFSQPKKLDRSRQGHSPIWRVNGPNAKL